MTPSSQAVDYSQLYGLHDPLADAPLRLSPQEDWLSYQDAALLFCGEWQPPRPIVLRASMGGRITDFLWTGFPPLVCVSQRLVDLLLENRFTGWATYPVQVYGRKGEPLAGYHGFAIKSYAGQEDFTRSTLITKPSAFPGGKWEFFRGVYFDESKWDGSDIFRVGGVKVVTERVQQAFRKAKVTNVRFVSLLEEEASVDTIRIIRGELG